MDKYAFQDLYEEIKNETDEQLLADFYDHWGKPFKRIEGITKEPEEPP